ncbi:hypothetical protein GUJ93_ZPchr0005g14553 [Zizania palustris]|uniref:Uncharacterized protein n=1 Tax=Zizania palustris TaxID=103762 RepID=A0A8J5SRC2_ZIZPA|nr:hypothetical protein GUJ93_ZPchr0005g14553 [Zizania palustris]
MTGCMSVGSAACTARTGHAMGVAVPVAQCVGYSAASAKQRLCHAGAPALCTGSTPSQLGFLHAYARQAACLRFALAARPHAAWPLATAAAHRVDVRLPRGSPPGRTALSAQAHARRVSMQPPLPRTRASSALAPRLPPLQPHPLGSDASTLAPGAQSACAPLPQPTASQWRRFLSLVPLFKPPLTPPPPNPFSSNPLHRNTSHRQAVNSIPSSLVNMSIININ